MVLRELPFLNQINRDLSILRNKYHLTDKEMQGLFKEDAAFIPLNIFSFSLSPLESVVKFLKEDLDYSYHNIGRALNRDERTIWVTYNNARKKKKDMFKFTSIRYIVPLNVFADRKFSILENLCLFLVREHNLEIKMIAKLLKKHTSSVWTVYKRALRKYGK